MHDDRIAVLPTRLMTESSPIQADPTPSSMPRTLESAVLRWFRKNWRTQLLGFSSLAALLLLWHLATLYRVDFFIRFTNIPTPVEVFHKVIEVNQSEKYLTNVLISLRRILLGFLIAAVVGISIGLIVGRYTLARQLVLPWMEVFRPIPAIAWVPMSIMLWPTNEISIVFITFLGAVFPIFWNTMQGVQAIDKVLLRAARSLGAHELSLFQHVILPGVLPHIFTGLAVGMGVSWVSLIAAEMISGQFGVGYFTWEAYSLVSYSEIALGMITIGLLGLFCSAVIRLIGVKLMPWLAFSLKESNT